MVTNIEEVYFTVEPTPVHSGLDQNLMERISAHYISDGTLYGALPQTDVTVDERMALVRVGWILHNYQDRPVLEPPQMVINWAEGHKTYRDNALHAIAHRIPGAPFFGTRLEILEELIDSSWDQQVEDLRVVLHAWAFASLWDQPRGENHDIEAQQTFFFYTNQMRKTAADAFSAIMAAPDQDHEFWGLVSALTEVEDTTP